MSDTSISAREVFEELAGATLPEWPVIESAMGTKHLRKGDVLFHAGQPQPFVFVVERGLLKMTYETEDGDCWVKSFVAPGTCFASVTALTVDGVTSFSVSALTDSRVRRIPYAAILERADRHIEWQRAVARAFEIYGFRKEKREMELLTLDAARRYLRFIEDFRDITNDIPQKDIASYIRVTPVALSRIKLRLRRRAG